MSNGDFRGKSGRVVKLTIHLLQVPGPRISGATHLRPSTPSWRAQGRFYTSLWNEKWNVLLCSTVLCKVLQCTTVLCKVLQYGTVLCKVLHCSTVLCKVLQYICGMRYFVSAEAGRRFNRSVSPAGRPIAHKLPPRKLSGEFIWFKWTQDQISAWISVWNETNRFVTKSFRISISYVTGNPANWKPPFRTKNNSSEILCAMWCCEKVLCQALQCYVDSHCSRLHRARGIRFRGTSTAVCGWMRPD